MVILTQKNFKNPKFTYKKHHSKPLDSVNYQFIIIISFKPIQTPNINFIHLKNISWLQNSNFTKKLLKWNLNLLKLLF